MIDTKIDRYFNTIHIGVLLTSFLPFPRLVPSSFHMHSIIWVIVERLRCDMNTEKRLSEI